MKHHHTTVFRAISAVLAVLLSVAPVILSNQSVSAAQIVNRSLTLQAGGTAGGSKSGGVVNHLFSFRVPGGSTVGSIKFQYCETAADVSPATCSTPTGLLTTSATLGSESGVTGFTMVNGTNGAPYLSRTPAAVGSNVDVTYQLQSVTNPVYGATVPDTNKTFFVRISTYASNNTTGSPVDTGVVAASTAEPIILSGTMPESLVFCTGADITTTAGVPDCSTATSGVISFNQLFSPTDTASAISRMSATTNAGSGYVISVNGPTLTSGSNTIAGITTPSASTKGIAQFGLNLRANTAAAAPGFPGTAPLDSADITTASNGTNLNGRPTADYAVADTFKFVTGDIVADSNFGATGNPDPTDAQIYTVSYIANVPGSQPAGTYVTTLTYICTATF
jgi:hypothetical protein